MREQTPQRYDLITNYRCGSSIEEMELADDGEWVRWESVEAELSALRAEQTRLREALPTWIRGRCWTCGESENHGWHKQPKGLGAGVNVRDFHAFKDAVAALSSTPTPETT